MANKRFDAVFIGNGLISLTAAASLAKAGQSVLLLDPTHSLDSGSPEAFRFSEGPLLYFGYETGGAMEGFFSQLAYPIPSLQQQGLRFKRVSPMLQIVQTSHRINLYASRESYFDELKREYSEEIQKLNILLDQVTKETASYYAHMGQFQQLEIAGMGERLNEWKKRMELTTAVSNQKRQKASDFLGQFAFGEDLRKYFDLLSLFAFKRKLREVSMFDLIMLLSGFQKGGIQMMGGYATLVRFFQRLIQSRGGVTMSGKAILSLEKNGNQITGIKFSNGKSLSGRHFVVTQHPAVTTLTLYFTLPQALIPFPMKEALLMSWGDDLPSDFEDLLEDIIVVRLNHLGEESSEPGKRLLAASLLLRPGSKISEAEEDGLREKLLDRLYWLMPFSRSRIEVASASLLSSQLEACSEAALNSFLKLSRQGIMGGDPKNTTKRALSYLQPRGEKNVFVVNSDQSSSVAWGSDFLAGSELANLLIKSKIS